MPDLFLPAEARREILREYGRQYGLKTFVETGTNDGATPWALKEDFAKIYTIELGQERFREAKKRFRDFPHVVCLFGDSGTVIKAVLDKFDGPALFWLDGHCSGPGTARGDLDTPVEQELNHLFEDGRQHVILVDDARCFKGGAEHELEPHYADFPTLTWVEEAANEHGFDYLLENDIIRLTPRTD